MDGGCGDVRLASGAGRVARTRKFCPEQSGPSRTESAGRGTVGRVTRDQVREIAEKKIVDLNCASVEAAMSMVEGSARSMGLEVVG